MADVRRILVIFVIAILFAILINVSIEAFYPQPEYSEYCEEIPRPVSFDEEPKIPEIDDTCKQKYDQAREGYNLIVFIVSALSGLAALIVGLHLPQKRNIINEWVGSGFLLGGLLTILVGTVRYFGDMGRFVRPFIILAELVLVIYLAYRKLGKR